METAKTTAKKKIRLPLHLPHTRRPGVVDDERPTCSPKSEQNKGCGEYTNCRLHDIKLALAGPVQIVIEDHQGTEPGKGRRKPWWCFAAHHEFWNKRGARAGFIIAEDRVYEAMMPNGKFDFLTMEAPEDQGPYYRPLPSEQDPAVAAARQAAIQERAHRANDEPRKSR